MLSLIKNKEDFLKNLNMFITLQDQVKALRFEDRLGKQNFHEDMKGVFEPVTETFLNTSEDVPKTVTEVYIENNKALASVNDKLFELLNNRGVLASCLLSPLSKTPNPGDTSQFKLINYPDSNQVNRLLINKTIPVTLYTSLLTFCGTDKKSKLEGDVVKMITNKNYNFGPAKLSDKKIMFDCAKEKYFDEKSLVN